MAAKGLTVEQIMTRGENEGWTAYGIARLINAKLTEAGLPEIRPQMVYNMDRQGSVVKGQKNVTAERKFTTDEATEFVNRYVTMRINKANKAPKTELLDCFSNVDEISAELAEENPTLI
jgi:hypothetical protein